jgi:soluble P-type ATPase
MVIVSGDRESELLHLAAQVGITEIYSPEGAAY